MLTLSVLSKKQRVLALFQRKQKIDEDGTTGDELDDMSKSRIRYNSDPSEHKTEVDDLRQVLRSYLQSGQKLDKTDKRLLCGIYEGKVEEVSDDSKEDYWGHSQETAKMPELVNQSLCSLESNPEIVKQQEVDDLFMASVPKQRTSTLRIPKTSIEKGIKINLHGLP